MKRATDAGLIAVLVLLPVLFHWRILTPVANDAGAFPPGDFGEQFYAFARFAADELAQGHLPLWNPYTYAGHPFAADVQSALFYPPSLIMMLASLALGGFTFATLEWQAVLHFSLAGAFTYLFARRVLGRHSISQAQGSARGAAFLSAVTFTFGGYLTSYPSQQLAVLQTDVWLPLVLLCLDVALWGHEQRARTDGEDGDHKEGRVQRAPAWAHGVRWGAVAAAGLFFGVAVRAGHPQSALYVLLASGAYALFAARLGRRSWRTLLGTLVLFLVVALGIAAVQWMPSLEFMLLSSRQSLTYADYARGFDLYDPVQMLLPGSVSAYSPLYTGIVPLGLAMLAVWLAPFARQRAWVWFWLAVVLAALALSFGGNLFVYPLFYLFAPGFALFRQQERAAFLVSFGIAMLAGTGLLTIAHALPHAAHRRLRAFARLAGRAVAGAAILFVLAYFGWMVAELHTDSAFRAAAGQAAWLALMLGAFGVLMTLRLQGRLRGAALAATAILLAALDLCSVNWQTNFHAEPPAAQTRAPAFLSPVLQDGGLYRTTNEYRIYGNFGDVLRIEDTWGASPLRLARYEQFHKLPMERVWHLLNVKYVITWRQSLAEMGVTSTVVAEQKTSERETTYVHRLENIAPRAALVERATVVGAQGDPLARLGAPDFDMRREVVLEAPLARLLAPQAGGTVSLLSRTANGSQWEASARGDTLMVLSENDYPGWRAFVDGVETPIVRANYVMRAVPVPAGTHRVEFVFDPWSVKLGAAITIATLAALVAAGGRSLRRRKTGT